MSRTAIDVAAEVATRGDRHRTAAEENLRQIKPGIPVNDAQTLAHGAQAQALLYVGASLERIANALEATR